MAAAAYMSCGRIYNDYDGIQHDYTRKRGLVWQGVFLPEYAPPAWQDRAVLWNAVEQAEKAKDSRLAREFVAALPVELGPEQWQQLVSDFIQTSFVAEGMCADVAIHNTDGHNPHAHIMLTVRPLNRDGTWQQKTEKEYLCVRGGEERGFTAAEYLSAQKDGWEKQYRYLVGKKKVYMSPSKAEAKGYTRASKYPKSTKYGWQNPISERWNSEEQLSLWRAIWADMSNRSLEQAGLEERIDRRSHAERGLDEQPTVHEGAAARITERCGGVSDRCELNRRIRADNALLRELKASVKRLMQAVRDTPEAIADWLEILRAGLIVIRYQHLNTIRTEHSIRGRLNELRPKMQRVAELDLAVRDKAKERKSLTAEKDAVPVIFIPKKRELARRIAELTEDLEELRSEKAALLASLGCAGNTALSAVRKDISEMEKALARLSQQEKKCGAALDAGLKEYEKARAGADRVDPIELYKARLAVRPEKEQEAQRRVQETCGDRFSQQTLEDSRCDVSRILGEELEDYSIRTMLSHRKQEVERKSRAKREKQRNDWSR